MDRMLYVAMSGAKQNMLAQAVNANNLANISTTGFRSDLAAMQNKPVYGDGMPSRVYAMADKTGIDFTPGALNNTGRELDVAIHGDGFFAVQINDGTEAYTRAGNFKTNNAGVLQTATGLPVIGLNGPIVIPPSSKVDIGKDGTVSIVPANGDSNLVTIVDRLKLVNPELSKVEKSISGLFVLKNGEQAAADSEVTLIPGTLETSNVNAAASLVNMIELQRQFEMQIKMLKEAEENNTQAMQIMRLA